MEPSVDDTIGSSINGATGSSMTDVYGAVHGGRYGLVHGRCHARSLFLCFVITMHAVTIPGTAQVGVHQRARNNPKEKRNGGSFVFETLISCKNPQFGSRNHVQLRAPAKLQ